VDIILVPVGGGGLITGISTLTKQLNPSVEVIGVEPTGAASMKASLEAGHVVSLPTASTIADGVAVKTPGDKVFPYVQKNVDRIQELDDSELVEAFLDLMERHKMVVENAGLLTVAALRHLDFKRRGVKASCRSAKNPLGGYDFICTITEGETVLLSITLWTDTRERAARMEEQFRRYPENTYRATLALMSGNVNYLFDS
jgi:threonine dehydratase